MTDQLISFETAKLAKEKGMNCYSEDYYYNSNGRFNTELSAVCNDNLITKTYTQSLLQKWLRDMHGLNVEIRYDPKEGFLTHRFYIVPIITKKINVIYGDVYKSYEEALEQCLIEALKIIE